MFGHQPEALLQLANPLAGLALDAGLFLAILLGTMLGGWLIAQSFGVTAVSAVIVAVAVLGYLTARAIPAVP